ncbi:MAG: hypothetical protein ACKVQW_00870 [Pyrinomonadaceae bacterium]
MELEFDKEIDAILRRGRSGLTGAATGEHLDADVVAAFAEGAVPERARPLYTRHLADCDRCRKLLSQAIAMNTAAPLAADGAAASVVESVSGSSSWFGNLFRAPSFALSMGALVLVFGGTLGYIVLKNQSLETATVSQSSPEMQKGGPSAGIELNEQIADSNNALAQANKSANAAASNVSALAPANTSVAARPADDPPATFRADERPFLADGVTAAKPEPAPAPPAAADKPVEERDKEKLKRDDDKNVKDETGTLLGGVRQETEDRRASGDVSLAKKKTAGPTRSGPVPSQNQVNTQTYEMPVTRSAGGKKFTNRNGAWYDTAYRGQATTNVRRGTDAYKKLDDGVRSIADSLGGTVIVVWKDKAYRIH